MTPGKYQLNVELKPELRERLRYYAFHRNESQRVIIERALITEFRRLDPLDHFSIAVEAHTDRKAGTNGETGMGGEAGS